MRTLPLILVLAALLTAGCTAPQPPEPAVEQTAFPLEQHDAATLQAMMESGDLCSLELTRHCLDRIRRLDDAGPQLNAVIEVNPDAMEIAMELHDERREHGPRGPLHGIPVLLKANIDTGDRMTTTAGSKALAGHRAGEDAFLVARLRAAGAVILGKTNLSEWANFRSTRSSSGWSSIGGQTKNPHVLDRSPCGSSSGSAVAVAASLAPLAVGTETDGSVVCPAGTTGIVGIKPTLGLVSRQGIIPIAISQDTAGPMARTVRDAAALLAAMAGADPDDPAAAGAPHPLPDYLATLGDGRLDGLRIGVMRDYYGAGGNTILEEAFTAAIERFRGLGAEIVDPADLGEREGLDEAEYEVLLYEFKAGMAEYLAGHGSPNGMATLDDLIAFNDSYRQVVMHWFGQEIFTAAAQKGPLTDRAYLDALERSKQIAREAIDRALAKDDLDLLIAPTNGPAWVIDLVNGDSFGSSVASSTLPAVSGYPSLTQPMGHVYGLPIGITLFSTAWTEALLIRAAHAFEQASPPPLSPTYSPSLPLDHTHHVVSEKAKEGDHSP
jgi:amidase